MSEWIDHEAETMWLLGSTGPMGFPLESASISAQAHATLALVEQQRIANLIALGILDVDEIPETGERGLLYRPPDDVQSCPNIAATLGIGDDDE